MDGDEPQAITTSSGQFVFDRALPQGSLSKKIISLGGVNKNSGFSVPHLGLISELSDSSAIAIMVTPITTLLSAIELVPEREQFLKMMGLTQTTAEIYTVDTWQAAFAGDDAAQNTERLNEQISLLIMSLDCLFDPQALIDPLVLSGTFVRYFMANVSEGKTSLSEPSRIKAILYQSHTYLLSNLSD
jgi:hypothetical protein